MPQKVQFQKKSKKNAKAQPKQVAKRTQKPRGYAPGLLGNLGATAGGFFGGPAGAMLGKSAGSWLGRITGMGGYKVNSNSLLSDAGPPTFRDNGDGSISLCKREFLTDLSGSTAFTVQQTIAINPGLAASFPFLSLIASNFEVYELKGLIFEFKSTSADALNSTNTALGTVIMATTYDPADSAFTSKQQMEAYQFASSTKPSESILHPVECDPSQNVMDALYVRASTNPTNTDIRFYDHGTFTFATSGMQAAAVIGELWVSYHVILKKPKIPTPIGANLLCSALIPTPVTTSAHYGVTTADGTTNTLAATATGNVLTIPAVGRYTVNYRAICATTFTASATTATTNCSIVLFHGTNVSGWPTATQQVGNGTTNYSEFFIVDVTAAPATLTTAAPTIVGAVTATSLYINQINGGTS